ncbi:hypothetical protein PENTCL1PPCAC_23365, partial [Pristionchus entomophagus]
NCSRAFAFPPSSKFSFFAEAKIGHLEIGIHISIYIHNDNLSHLTTLLSGCTVDKVTLVFDKKTLSNLKTLPAFLSFIHVKHLEFVLE